MKPIGEGRHARSGCEAGSWPFLLLQNGREVPHGLCGCFRQRETAQPQKIILFGSRARGDARPDSDFDLLVIKESSEPGYRRDATLYAALADLPVEVDVLVYTPEEVAEWARVPQAFVSTATREGKTIYERES
jgi:uncharacterized protein